MAPTSIRARAALLVTFAVVGLGALAVGSVEAADLDSRDPATSASASL